MKKSLTILILLLFYTINCLAQNSSDNLSEKGILFKYEKTGGLFIHTSGFGLNYRQEKHITGYKKRIYEIELTGMKHQKEIKSANPLYSDAKSYVYGKLNTLTILRGGIGLQKVINSKSRAFKSAIELRSHTSIGFSAGFTKPVYLYIMDYSPLLEPVVKTEKYDPDKHYVDNIYGKAPFTKGLNEIKFHPGAYAKFGLSADYAPSEEAVKSLEIGTCIDYFPDQIELMAFNPNKSIFISFYLSFNIGKRYN